MGVYAPTAGPPVRRRPLHLPAMKEVADALPLLSPFSARCGRCRSRLTGRLRPAAAQTLRAAQLPRDRPHALPAGRDPTGAAAVLHRTQLGRPPLRPG